MSIFGAFDISASGLQAQRVRMDAISANLANQRTPGFRPVSVEFAPGDPASGSPFGVHVSAIRRETGDLQFTDRFEPAPIGSVEDLVDGRSDGLAPLPDISVEKAMVDGIEALRAYEANIQALDATRSMIDSALRVLA